MASSTSTRDQSLSGDWQGSYLYSVGQAVPFLARLSETAGVISGDTVEPESSRALSFCAATLSGGRQLAEVFFTKVYLDPPPGYGTPIAYRGQVTEDCRRISGRWMVSGISGTFEMQREAEIKEPVGVEIAIGVDEEVEEPEPVNGRAS